VVAEQLRLKYSRKPIALKKSMNCVKTKTVSAPCSCCRKSDEDGFVHIVGTQFYCRLHCPVHQDEILSATFPNRITFVGMGGAIHHGAAQIVPKQATRTVTLELQF
jgi:hypothetical protein